MIRNLHKMGRHCIIIGINLQIQSDWRHSIKVQTCSSIWNIWSPWEAYKKTYQKLYMHLSFRVGTSAQRHRKKLGGFKRSEMRKWMYEFTKVTRQRKKFISFAPQRFPRKIWCVFLNEETWRWLLTCAIVIPLLFIWCSIFFGVASAPRVSQRRQLRIYQGNNLLCSLQTHKTERQVMCTVSFFSSPLLTCNKWLTMSSNSNRWTKFTYCFDRPDDRRHAENTREVPESTSTSACLCTNLA